MQKLNKCIFNTFLMFSKNSSVVRNTNLDRKWMLLKRQTNPLFTSSRSSYVKWIWTIDSVSRMKKSFSTSSKSLKNEIFFRSQTKLEQSHDFNRTSQEKRTLSTDTVYNEQHSILLLKEALDLKNKKISSWVVENKIKNLCSYYKCMKKDQKERFLTELATKYAVNHELVSKASHQMADVEIDSEKMIKTEEKLKTLLTPTYIWLFKYIGRLEMGVKFLVNLRTDVMDLLPEINPTKSEYIAVQQLNTALRELLTVWFSVGFLNLERITWKSPCSMLEKISEYEAVHPIKSWVDLKHRVGPYRRCFVYTHNSMPEEPLVVLHVALTEDIVSSMTGITTPTTKTDDVVSIGHGQTLNQLDEDPQLVKAFIFYSISSTQRGLQGIELGNYLIKGAAKLLQSEYPHATMYSTLSPIPTFHIWLITKIKLAEKGEQVFSAGLWDKVLQYLDPEKQSWSELRKVISTNSWYQNPELISLLQNPLMVCCSRYLYLEKRRGYAYDSVANFHLRNGAVMWRLNWLADVSPRGLTRSCGLMVNYRYYLDEAEANSINYVENQAINVSEQIVSLSRGLSSKL